MENNQDQTPEMMQPTAQLQITPESLSLLSTTAKWTKFLSILGFVAAGFLVIGGIAFSVFYTTLGRELTNSGPIGLMSPGLLGLIYIIITICLLLPVIYLNNFSNYAAGAVKSGNTERLTKAIRNLKRLFRFLGLLTIVFLIIYLIVIIAAIVAGSMLI